VGCPVGFVGPLEGGRVGLIEGDPAGAVISGDRGVRAGWTVCASVESS
jgi:hypothetical protein